ncbi:vacuolar protein sorting 35 [Echinococcus multilocularis]|uniref:Vacuolar protein sorting-associated protein 35 n=1 Tax=Echinococcus multilocularis TaxID=6211 RepID=A0A087VXQ3_ECHMU|nr:vacuolar protein sorting 35 [Echinococcus multilocularis]
MSVNEGEKLLDRMVAAIEQQKQAVKMMMGLIWMACIVVPMLFVGCGLLASHRSPITSSAAEVLNVVDVYLTDEFQHGRSIPHLYEIVQYVSNVLPRLYLLITVGVVYIRVGELPCREILRDLVEMCRGVQHPLRGLFLRNYLLTSIPPSLLPDSPPLKREEVAVGDMPMKPAEVEGASVLDSINFILLNFAEMNKLWVRMQHQGHTRDRERREQERRDLRVLVGANLHRLSKLEAINTDLYRSHILPNILTQVIQCHDVIAQEYLMDVIVQTFPDEFHAATLPQLLQACEHLQPAVRLKPIIGSLVERLLRCISEESRSGGGGEELFQSLSTELGQLVRRRADFYTSAPTEARLGLPLEDLPGLFAPLLTMAICLHSSPDTVNQVLLSAAAALETLSASSFRIQGGSVLSRELLSLLYLPLYGPGGPPRSVNSSVECATLAIFSSGVSPLSPSTVGLDDAGALGRLPVLLGLSGLLRLCTLLDFSARRRFACLFIARALERASSGDAKVADNQRITTEADLDAFLAVVGVLVERQDSNTTSVSSSSPSSSVEDLTEELALLASAIHLVGRQVEARVDIEEKLLLLSKMRKQLAAGGPVVVRATFPTLVFEAIRLLPVIGAGGENIETDEPKTKEAVAGLYERVIAFCHQSATKLIACNASDVALRLFLNCTLVIETVAFEKRPLFAYEFFSQAFTLFEQELSDARAQLSAFGLLVATLWWARRCLDAESAGVLQTQCSRAAFNLLLLRADQSRAVALTAQLLLSSPTSIIATPGEEGKMTSGKAGESDFEGVFKCLEKSRSLADMCMDVDARTQLYVDLLNYHIIYHQQGVGPLETMKMKLTELLAETDKLVQQLEFVPEAVSFYLESTRSKVLEILDL